MPLMLCARQLARWAPQKRTASSLSRQCWEKPRSAHAAPCQNARFYAAPRVPGVRPSRKRKVSAKEPDDTPAASQASQMQPPPNSQQQPQETPPEPEPEPQQSRAEALSSALREGAGNVESGLVSDVHVGDDPHGVLKPDHPAAAILAQPSILVQRQIEMMNVIIGFEQANKYVIMDPHGNTIGYLAEQDHGVGSTMRRQMFKTHRSFTTHVFDKNEREVLRFHRPFSWVSSTIRIYDCIGGNESEQAPSDALEGTSSTALVNQTSAQVSLLPPEAMRIIGEASQQWAPFRRKYNLCVHRNAGTDNEEMQQFSHVDEPILSWDFSLQGGDSKLLGSVNRNFAGFAREIFTDTGVYALRMDSAGLQAGEPQQIEAGTAEQQQQQLGSTQESQAKPQTSLVSAAPGTQEGMTLDQRAVMLATAVSIDFDYFSRHSGALGGGIMPIPLWFPMGGGAAGEAGAAGAAGGAAGEVGAAEGAAGALGEARGAGAGAIGAAEGMSGAATGAGTMAGVEAMRGRGQPVDDASPMANDPYEDGGWGAPQQGQEEEVWGEQEWNDQFPSDGGSGESGGGGGGGGGGEGGSGWSVWDIFDNL